MVSREKGERYFVVRWVLSLNMVLGAAYIAAWGTEAPPAPGKPHHVENGFRNPPSL
jgi:hypothetical protein